MSVVQTDVLLAGRYRVGRLIGSGGFGSVYLATDERLHRPVAIKVCSTRSLPPHEAADAARLFQSEALTLARLRHPGLTAIWDYFNQDDDWYLVMEYVPGETLRTLIKQNGGPLPYADALSYTRQLCAVLGYLHRQYPPVVFRDLKPGNIMITSEGQLKLIDFGIARLFSPGKTADTSQFGTPGYAPPEQYGGQTEPRSDIYSMGVVLHQMLTGHNPTTTPFMLPPVRALNPAIPAPIEELVATATAYAIHDRIPTAEAFCDRLDQATARPGAQYATTSATAETQAQRITGSRPVVWTPAARSLPTRPSQGGWGRVVIMIVLLVLLLSGIGVGGYLLRSQIAMLTDDLAVVAPVKQVLSEKASMTVFSAESGGTENLFLMSSNGQPHQITAFDQTARASQPSISPDGTRIAFSKEIRRIDPDTQKPISLRNELWVMNIDGSNQQQLLGSFPLARAAAWSPNGTALAVEVADDGLAWRDHDVVIVDVASGAWRSLIATPSWEGGPGWSPDGTRIVYHARTGGVRCMQLFMINAQGGQPEQLTDLSNADCTSTSSGDYWADWSPDGTQIAFGRKISGTEHLALLNLETRKVRLLNVGDQMAGYPRWSSDGRSLLFEIGKNPDTRLARIDVASCKDTCDVKPIETAYAGSHLADWH